MPSAAKALSDELSPRMIFAWTTSFLIISTKISISGWILLTHLKMKCMDICHHCPGIIHLLMKMKCTGLHHQGAVIIHLLMIGVNLLWLSIQIRNQICQYFLNSPNKGKRAILNTFLSWISPVYHWRKITLKLLKLQSNTIFWFR